MAVNASFVSPTADAQVAHMIQQFDTNGLLSSVFTGFTVWKFALTLLVAAVVYDQCTIKILPPQRMRRTLLTRVQSSTFGTRDRLLDRHGKHLSSDLS